MKTVLFFFLLLVSFSSFSQTIEFEKGKYYLDNQKISVDEVKNLLKTNHKALTKFEAGRTKSTMGIVLFAGGLGLMAADVVTSGNTYGAAYPTIKSGIGAAFFVISIPVYINHNKRIKQGLEIYNNELQDKKTSFNYNIIYNQNGVGLTLQF